MLILLIRLMLRAFAWFDGLELEEQRAILRVVMFALVMLALWGLAS